MLGRPPLADAIAVLPALPLYSILKLRKFQSEGNGNIDRADMSKA
jgi:hypothetical protein